MDRSGQFSNDPGSQSLADQIAASSAYWTQDQAEELVWQSEQAGVNTSGNARADMLSSMAETTGAGTGDPGINLEVNDSGVYTRGIITNEFALTYGHAFFDKKLGFGGNVKYIYGVTFNSFLRYDDVDSVGDALDQLFDSREQQAKLELRPRPGPQVQGHRLARPRPAGPQRQRAQLHGGARPRLPAQRTRTSSSSPRCAPGSPSIP